MSQVCRNINRVKICMEEGRTVILLNLENLYESLYDALNQVSFVIRQIYTYSAVTSYDCFWTVMAAAKRCK